MSRASHRVLDISGDTLFDGVPPARFARPWDTLETRIPLHPPVDEAGISSGQKLETRQDQLELWWCLERECSSVLSGDTVRYLGLRHLSITQFRDENPVAVWRRGGEPNDPAPAILQGTDGALTVRFTHESLGIENAQHWYRPFTVLFVDADSLHGTPTRIATSDLEPNQPLSFGALVRYPDLHPFPTHTAGVREDLEITSIRKLAPGQARIRAPE